MKVYQDLNIYGSRQALDAFIVRLDQCLADGWTRSEAREAEIGHSGAFGRMLCFLCAPEGMRPASELWIATHSDGSLYVSNIWAPEFRSLSYDQYNSILSEFYESCVKPAANMAEVDVELSNSEPRIEDFFSPKTVELLRHFSHCANRSHLHPLDEDRWYKFVTSAHRDGAVLDSSMLKRWLIEDEKWSEDTADRLVTRYAEARSLLKVYEALPA